MSENTLSTTLADKLFPDMEPQDGFAEGILSIPVEERKLHTETYDFTVETLFDKLKNKSIFVPEFQRRYVWTDVQASRLIESLIIQCPIPVLYLTQEKDERLSVIDGNQRLTSIKRFLSNEFQLKGLTAYPDLEGFRFFELDPRFQRHIENRVLRCIVILKETHPQVKFDVFERLNTGATKLTPQELRHGLYFGKLMELATTCVKSSNFLSALEIKADKRMKAEELILRFWALSEKYSSYKKPLASFINSFSEEKRDIDEKEQQKLKESFIRTLSAVKELLGNFSFKIFLVDRTIESAFNAALYDALMIGVSQLLSENKLAVMSTDEAIERLGNLIKDDLAFRKAISIATSDESALKKRVSAIKRIFGR